MSGTFFVTVSQEVLTPTMPVSLVTSPLLKHLLNIWMNFNVWQRGLAAYK